MSKAYDQHTRAAEPIVARCAVVTLSDTRTPDTDGSGRRTRELLEADGHTLHSYRVIPDDARTLDALLTELLSHDDLDVVLTNGGTGISGRDHTVPVVKKRISQPIPGFGELFRMLSWEQNSSGAMLSRAVGGIGRGKILFAMPGSTPAVELAMTRLILPELRHLLHELRK